MDSMYNSYASLLMSDELNDDHNIDQLESQIPSEIVPLTGTSRRSQNFSIDDDKLLVSAWLNTSKDSTHGNAQNANRYWQRISEFFNTHGGPRTQASLKQRWNDINKKCQKFSGYLSQIEERHPSGQTEQGMVDDAKSMYADLEHKPFLLEHCWIILKDEAKWQETLSNKRHKTSSVSVHDLSESPIGGDNDERSINQDRPLGTKAAKKLAASGSKSSISDEILKEKHNIERAKYEQRDRALLEQQRDRELKEREMERSWEIEVMSKDLRGMDPMVAEYWKNARIEIMAKKGYNF
ncbi:glutathione S-transferase T3-like [Tripterygium wilfordii]|uniref:glutathione S-transferase T3-like n=1 Tax=Tripterygium wilfordii TaxID=458696 RepID=UPI0018F80588|nr:glutathione S-transferase T3-like [Tripterygium wilfordii]XP_038709476.1 glutathione S-transferase T3-like [Tripterygium wilfordii]XP_038709477.1 glutathione S-transferase T3-like [Tripterygium wilfordii]